MALHGGRRVLIRRLVRSFLCKMKEPEILESLIPSITANLEHRHSCVPALALLLRSCVCSAH